MTPLKNSIGVSLWYPNGKIAFVSMCEVVKCKPSGVCRRCAKGDKDAQRNASKHANYDATSMTVICVSIRSRGCGIVRVGDVLLIRLRQYSQSAGQCMLRFDGVGLANGLK